MPSPKAPKPQVWIPAAILLASLLAAAGGDPVEPKPFLADGGLAVGHPENPPRDSQSRDLVVTTSVVNYSELEKHD